MGDFFSILKIATLVALWLFALVWVMYRMVDATTDSDDWYRKYPESFFYLWLLVILIVIALWSLGAFD